MKRLFLYGMIGCILAIFIPSVVSASDTSDALYAGTIKVTNNGTATTGVATTISGINTTSLIADGFLYSSANDSAILRSGSDVAFMPGYGENPWILYVASIGADTTFNDIFYTPNVPDGKECYFPDTSGMVIDDDATIEPGNEFSVNISGRFNAGNIVASMIGTPEELLVDGAGDATGISFVVGSATHYEAVDESYGSPSDAEYVWTSSVTEQIDYYSLESSSIPVDAVVDNITVHFRVKDAGGIAHARPYLRLDATNTAGTTIDPNPAFTNHTETLTKPGGGSWQVSDLASLQVGIGLWITGASSYCSQISVVVAWHYEVSYTSTGDDYDVIVSSNTTHLIMTVDDSIEDTTATFGDSVINNGSDWYFATSTHACSKSGAFTISGVMPYLEYVEINVSGTQKCFIDWEYGTTFSDSSGNSNDATPTFRTTSSDADVSANLTDFYPISEATAPAYAVSDAEDFISGAPNITGNFTTSIDPSFPGSGIIEDTATDGGTPVQMPFIWLGCLGLLAASFLTSSVATYFRSNSILPKILIVGIIAAALVGLKVFDFWMLLYLIIPLLAFAVAKTHTTWGGESGYNMAGFLAMSFVGMTIINRIMEGAFLSSTDVSILNNVLVFRPVNVFGLFQISVPNMSFLTQGLPHLIRWDYSFFGGNAVIIQYLFYSITAFMAFLLFVIMLGVVFNMLSRSR